MTSVCPETFAKAKAYPKDAVSICLDRSLQAMSTCPAKLSIESSTGMGTTHVKITVPHNVEEDDFELPIPSRTLKQLSRDFSHFEVADISMGAVFFDLSTFEAFAGDQRKPYPVPKIASLECPSDAAITVGRTSVFQIIKWCRKRKVNRVIR